MHWTPHIWAHNNKGKKSENIRVPAFRPPVATHTMSSSDDPNVEWVVATTGTWLHEALFLKSVLASAGIKAMIPNEYTLGVQPLYSNLLGGAQVLVRAKDKTRAEELLRSVDSQPESDPDHDAVS